MKSENLSKRGKNKFYSDGYIYSFYRFIAEGQSAFYSGEQKNRCKVFIK